MLRVRLGLLPAQQRHSTSLTVHSALEELLKGVQIDFLGHANVMVLGMAMLVGPPLWFSEKVNFTPTKQHVSMLRLACGSKHHCA